MQEEKVVLVDKFDNQLGLMPKMEAHLKGLLHRAFSVIILIVEEEYCFKKGLQLNTIPLIFGLILAVVIRGKERIILVQGKDG